MKNPPSVSDYEDCIKNPYIIHFHGGWSNRPWELKCDHPFAHKFIYYKNMSPWTDVELKKGRLACSNVVLRFIYRKFLVLAPEKYIFNVHMFVKSILIFFTNLKSLFKRE